MRILQPNYEKKVLERAVLKLPFSRWCPFSKGSFRWSTRVCPLSSGAREFAHPEAIGVTPLAHGILRWVVFQCVGLMFMYLSLVNSLISPHVCKSNGDETRDVDFLPERTAYFGLTTGGRQYIESTEFEWQSKKSPTQGYIGKLQGKLQGKYHNLSADRFSAPWLPLQMKQTDCDDLPVAKLQRLYHMEKVIYKIANSYYCFYYLGDGDWYIRLIHIKIHFR